MRVSGGTGRGRRLRVPSGNRVRPTSDKVKQALFNILGERVDGCIFLDLYAGAGGIGIEALSRGAARVTFVDRSKESITIIRENIEQTGYADQAALSQSDAETFLKKPSGPYDIVFLDPPYAESLEPLLDRISRAEILKPDSIIIAEHFKKQAIPGQVNTLTRYREARYGDTVLSFYKLSGTRMDTDQHG